MASWREICSQIWLWRDTLQCAVVFGWFETGERQGKTLLWPIHGFSSAHQIVEHLNLLHHHHHQSSPHSSSRWLRSWRAPHLFQALEEQHSGGSAWALNWLSWLMFYTLRCTYWAIYRMSTTFPALLLGSMYMRTWSAENYVDKSFCHKLIFYVAGSPGACLSPQRPTRAHQS